MLPPPHHLHVDIFQPAGTVAFSAGYTLHPWDGNCKALLSEHACSKRGARWWQLALCDMAPVLAVLPPSPCLTCEHATQGVLRLVAKVARRPLMAFIVSNKAAVPRCAKRCMHTNVVNILSGCGADALLVSRLAAAGGTCCLHATTGCLAGQAAHVRQQPLCHALSLLGGAHVTCSPLVQRVLPLVGAGPRTRRLYTSQRSPCIACLASSEHHRGRHGGASAMALPAGG